MHFRWKLLLLLHFLICSAGLIKLTMVLAGTVFTSHFLDYSVSLIGNIALSHNKLSSLLQYIIALPFLIVFYGLILWGASCKICLPALFKNKFVLIAYFVSNFIFTLCLY